MPKVNKKSRRVLLIANPQAGDPADPLGRIEQVAQFLNDAGLDVDITLEHPKKRARHIARQAVKDGYHTVAVLGGDGTIEAAIPALVGSKTRLAVLGGGTENNIARALGIPNDLEAACRLVADGECRKIDVGQIKVKKSGKKKMIFMEFAAVGIVAELFPEAEALYKRRLGEIVPAIEDLMHYQPVQMKLTIDDEKWVKGESLLVTVSNTPSFGVEYLLAPNASLEDGRINVNFYASMTKAGLGEYFLSTERGKRGDLMNPKVQHYQAKKLVIRCDPPQAVVADGQPLGKGTVRIKVLKGALRVVTGPRLGLASGKSAKAAKQAEKVPQANKEQEGAVPRAERQQVEGTEQGNK